MPKRRFAVPHEAAQRLVDAALPAMEKWGVKRSVLADKLGVSTRHLGNLLSLKTSMGIGVAQDICFHLGLPVEDYLPQENSPELLPMDLSTLQLLLTYLVRIDMFAPATAADLAAMLPRAIHGVRGDVTVAGLLDKAQTIYNDQ